MGDPATRVNEIRPDVYDITWQGPDEGPEIMQGYRLRTFLFDFDDDKPTLIDTCKSARVDTLFDCIDHIGVEPQRLIITHNHPDHVEAFDDVVERYGVETWVPEEDELTSVDRLSVRSPADNLYTHGESIGRFTAVHVPGHTPGNSVVIEEEQGIAVMGDTMSGSDRRGLPKGYLIQPPQSTHVNRPAQAVVDAEENLVRLLDYEFDTALVFHGSSVMRDASAKLDRYLNYERNYTSAEPSIHRPSREGNEIDYYDQ